MVRPITRLVCHTLHVVGQVANLRGRRLPPPAGPIDNRPQLAKLPRKHAIVSFPDHRHALSRSPLRSVAFGHHAAGTKKSCQPNLHSSIILRPYSLRPRSFGPVLFVPKVNLQPAAFAILTNAALGSL